MKFSIALPATVLIFALGLLAGPKAHAFPEMVRHGYTSCTACHNNHAGGGLLTEYGRGLSVDVLSQKTFAGKPSGEGDETFLGGALAMPSWLNVGGDVRVLQTFTESKAASRARFMIMQVDLDAQFQLSSFASAYASVGRIEPRVDSPEAKDFISIPRIGFDFSLSPEDASDRFTLRVGRFLPAFGIAFAEHTLATRRLLDFGPGQERYGAEFAWTNDTYSVIATGIALQANGNMNRYERGAIIQASRTLGDRAKLNLSYYQSTRESSPGKPYTRTVYGASAITELTKQWYALIEIDRQQEANEKWGLIEVLKVGFEYIQGLHFIAIQEYSNSDMDQSNPRFESYGIGVQWFPRTHWDLLSVLRRERNTAVRDEYDSVAWLIGHYYF